MGKVAFIFPGQGSQNVGMGQDVFDSNGPGRAVFVQADAALPFAISTICFNGPEQQLRLTEYTQPAIVATSIALWKELNETCDVAAGHSLGEYSAHVAAGTLTVADATAIVHKRGQFMQDAVPDGRGAMAAVMRAPLETVEEVLASVEGVAEAVNFNSPGQIVIAGEKDSIDAAVEALASKKARAIPLSVSAPFHSSLMKPAEEQLADTLRRYDFQKPEVPVCSNVDADWIRTAEEAKDALIRQVSRPVQWAQSIERMANEDVTLFVEIGPGKVLTGLCRRIVKDVERVNVSSLAEIPTAKESIAKHRGA